MYRPATTVGALALVLAAVWLYLPAVADAGSSPIRWSKSIVIDRASRPVEANTLEVACPSPELCLLVDQAGYVFTSTRPTGSASTWRRHKIATTLSSVACASETHCLVAGPDGIWATTTPTRGRTAWSHVATDGAGARRPQRSA